MSNFSKRSAVGINLNQNITGYNYNYQHLQPGHLLIEELIKEIVARGDVYCNMYGHQRLYKEQWCNKTEPLYRIKMFKKNMYTHSLNWVEETVRLSPRLVKSLRFIRSYVR